MVSPAPIINLIDKVWSPKDFEDHKLTVVSKTNQVAYEKIDPLITSAIWRWSGQISEGVRYWTGYENDPSSIYKVSAALDGIAMQELDQELLTALKQQGRQKTPQERYAVIQRCLANLVNINHNLENHNKVINDYNNHFYTNALVCPSHQKTIDKIQNEIQQLRRVEFEIGKEIRQQHKDIKNRLDNDLSLLNENIANGAVLDQSEILQIYFSLEESIEKMRPKARKEFSSRLNTLLNQSYLSNVVSRISKGEMPNFMAFVFKNLGISEREFKDKIEKRTPELVQQLQKRLEDSDVLPTLDPPDFINFIQQEILKFLSSEIPHVPQDRIIPLLNRVLNFEIELSRRLKDAQKKSRETAIEALQKYPISDEIKPIVLQKIQNFQFTSPIPHIIEKAFENAKFDFGKIAGKEEPFQQQFQQLKSKLESGLKYWSLSQLMGKQYVQIQEFILKTDWKRCHAWFEKNKEATKFRFNQNQWGSQEIFDLGACMAITYRWAKVLINNPSRIIRHPNDLEEGSQGIEERSFIRSIERSSLFRKVANKEDIQINERSGITAEDRKNQATYMLELALKANTQGDIGDTILKRDHLSYTEHVRDKKTIIEAIDSIEKTPLLAQGGGIFSISGYHKDQTPQGDSYVRGHAMGMQIDPTRHLYRFWDVNSGFYQYNTLEEMKNAFQSYLKEFYKDDFNSFNIGQYYPLAPA